MAENVRALIKKKGDGKKPRGKKAQLLKRREAVPVKPKRIIDKRNPFKIFTELDDNEMLDEMDSFMINVGWNPDRSIIDPAIDSGMLRIFNILKNGMPFPLVKVFFEEYEESDTLNIKHFFEEFLKKPNTQHRINRMKEIIERRKTEPLTVPKLEKQQRKIPSPKQIAIPQSQREKVDFKLYSAICESEYSRAPWMFPFTNQVIKGFAHKAMDLEYTLPVEIESGWFKVNKKWYKLSCEGKRKFIPNKIAYITLDDELIIETEQMFEASKKDWIKEFVPVDQNGFVVARRMLMDNQVIKNNINHKDLEKYIQDILDSFKKIQTHYDLARKLSYILVYLSPVIVEQPSFYKRIRDYRAGDLINLDETILLPEVFKNPNIDKRNARRKIENARKNIENRYYNLLRLEDKTLRIPTRPQPLDHRKPRSSSKQSFVLNNPEIADYAEPSSKRRIAHKQVASGVIENIKEKLNHYDPIFCHECHQDIISPTYTTIKDTDRLEFCSKECFEKFRF